MVMCRSNLRSERVSGEITHNVTVLNAPWSAIGHKLAHGLTLGSKYASDVFVGVVATCGGRVEMNPDDMIGDRPQRGAGVSLHLRLSATHACQQMLPLTSGPAQGDPRRFLVVYIHSYESEGVLGSTQ
jgi:hypothetical protein